KTVRIGHERRQYFFIAVFLRMDIEHEIDQRPFEPCAHAGKQRETGTGDFRRPVQIEYSQRRTEIAVGLGRKIEVWGIALAPEWHILFIRWTHRNGGIR